MRLFGRRNQKRLKPMVLRDISISDFEMGAKTIHPGRDFILKKGKKEVAYWDGKKDKITKLRAKDL